MSKQLINDFDSAMRNIYYAGLKLNPSYPANRFIKMLNESSGKEVADRLLASSNMASGLSELWERGALKISLEYLVLSQPWRGLFTEAQLAVAKKRLTDMNCSDIPNA